MIKMKMMPTALFLIVISLMIAISGIALGIFSLFFNINEISRLAIGAIIIFISLALASWLRMLAIIGQILFDIKKSFISFNQELNSKIQYLNQNIYEIKMLKEKDEQMVCDLKDINQNIYEIKTFFEQIERHLDLKK